MQWVKGGLAGGGGGRGLWRILDAMVGRGGGGGGGTVGLTMPICKFRHLLHRCTSDSAGDPKRSRNAGFPC